MHGLLKSTFGIELRYNTVGIMHSECCHHIETSQGQRIPAQVKAKIANRIDGRADGTCARHVAGVQQLAEQKHIFLRHIAQIKVCIVHNACVRKTRRHIHSNLERNANTEKLFEKSTNDMRVLIAHNDAP